MASAAVHSPAAGEADRLPLGRVLLAIGGIYTAQSLVGGLTFQGVPAVLRASGVSLDTIGLVSFAMLPWALKFLWAPAIERYRLPHGAPRRSGRIVVAGAVVTAAALAALGLIAPTSTPLLLAALMLVALASATVDIACDGFAVQQLSARNRGWGNTAQVGGGYLGIVFGGGLFLVLVNSFGWSIAASTMGALVLLLAIPFALSTEPKPGSSNMMPHRPSLAFALARREVRIGLVITAAFELGIRFAQGMVAPFLIDRGLDLALMGILNGLGGVAAGLVGTVLGGLALRFVEPSRAVMLAIIIQATVLALLLSASLLDVWSMPLLVAVFVLKAVVMAFGFVTLYSLLMGYSSLRQAGVDFTLFQCADAGVAAVGGFGGGFLAQHFGYGLCFALATGLSAAAAIFFPTLIGRIPIAKEPQSA
jgi:MFS transporter (putative signal transducer)